MHPNHDSIFLFGMSKGSLKLGDLRVSANINNTSINFKHSLSTQRNLLLDLISNISSVSFSKDKYLVSRDYLTIKIWDICNNKKPVNTIHINDCLKSKLSEMV